MNVVINKLVLGNRELGWECWNGKEVMEYTSKQLKDIIKSGKQKVCGLVIGSNGELELDRAGFFTSNMMVHSHIGSWKPMEEESMSNLLYVCIGSRKEADGVVYDCISSRFEQATITESDMRAYLKIGIVSGGAKLEDDKIIVASVDLEEKKEVPTEPSVTEKKESEKKTAQAKEVKPEQEKKEVEKKEVEKKSK